MRVAILLALTGCNAIFDLEPTHLPDQPNFVCPPIGQTPPFTRILRQSMARDCTAYSYTALRGRAIATCRTEDYAVEAGPIGGALAPVIGIPASSPAAMPLHARLSQDEQRIYVTIADNSDTALIKFRVYRRKPDDTWQEDPSLELQTFQALMTLGAFAFDGVRDRTIVVDQTLGSADEYAIGSTWEIIRPIKARELGVDLIQGMSMTSDGLRATFTGQLGVRTSQYYTDRARIEDAFRPGDRLDVPYDDLAFMTDDCSRIYLSGVGSVFYVTQAP